MTCQGCRTFECILGLTHGTVGQWCEAEAALRWLKAHNLVRGGACPKHGSGRSIEENGVLVCGHREKGCRNRCRSRLSDTAPWVKSGNSKKSIGAYLTTAYCIANGTKQKEAVERAELKCPKSYVEMEEFWGRIFTMYEVKHPVKFNRMQCDETYFAGKRKFNRGRRQRQEAIWIATAVEVGRNNRAERVRIRRIHSTNADSLCKFVEDHIVGPKSTVTTDCAKGYARIEEVCRHLKVNHQHTFVDPDTLATTNTVEGIHSVLKRALKEWASGKFGSAKRLMYRLQFASQFVTMTNWRIKLRPMFRMCSESIDEALIPEESSGYTSSDESDGPCSDDDLLLAGPEPRPQPTADPETVPLAPGRPRLTIQQRKSRIEAAEKEREARRLSQTNIKAKAVPAERLANQALNPFTPAGRATIFYADAMLSLNDRQHIESSVVDFMLRRVVVRDRGHVLRAELFSGDGPASRADRDEAPLPPNKLIFLPLVYGNHWILLVFRREEPETELVVYNSMRGYARRMENKVVEMVKAWIPTRWTNVKHVEAVQGGSEQQNPSSNDCGLFVINNAARVLNVDAEWERETVRVVLEHAAARRTL